jgi:DNA polymerase-3 subunit alpha
MEKSFSQWPEAISNTEKVAEKCNLELELGKIKLPNFNIPNGLTPDEYLEKICWESLNQHFPKKDKEVIERLTHELSTIKKTGFAAYFLITQDFVKWARENNIVVGPGRGSAAGSLVSYLLGITSINPLKYDLVFERFINPERISPPDIDLDFADNRRDEVIRYIENKYGRDHVAQIITFGTMGARVAVRDVGRVLGYPYNFCDRLAKMIPFNLDLKTALNQVAELKFLYETNNDARIIIDNAQKLEGVARHASRHACGLVISPQPLIEYLPTQYDVSGLEKTIITQYEMHSIEDLGLLKIDILGLKNLTLIEETIKQIKYNQNQVVDINKIPLDDKKTFALLQNGETIGVFQLESEGMRKNLKELKPTNLEDIIAMVALYRPGPMELIPEYIAGKHKKRRPKYLHPKLKPILEKTYGVAIYQEQLLEIARALAGFTLGEADILRKAIGKKIPELLKEQKEKFIQGCEKNNIPREVAETVFAFIEPFAGYGFNKSHATCYATIAYQTAYLKANYPAEFMAALLTSEQGDVDRVAIVVEECKRMGIEVLPPDINESFKKFTVITHDEKGQKLNKPKIRFGLLAIKNVGENIVENIIEERSRNGAFSSIENFLTRINNKDLNKKSLESLIKAGAFDRLMERGKLLGNLETLLDFAKQSHKDQKNHQVTIFSVLPEHKISLHLQDKPPATVDQKLFWEKELLGLFISGHPMETLDLPKNQPRVPIAKINPQATSVNIIGVITKIKKIITSNHETMLFVKIEDPTGSIEVIVFPSLINENRDLWQEKKVILVTGRPSDKEGILKVIAESVKEIK